MTFTLHPERLAGSAKHMLVTVALFVGMVAFSHCNHACKLPTGPLSPAELEAKYTAELVLCSTTAKTKADAAACRHAVNQKYGLCETGSYPKVTPCDE